MDEFDRRLLNRLQHGLPLEPHPYALLAAELDCREEDILRRLDDLAKDPAMRTPELTHFFPLLERLLRIVPDRAHLRPTG